MTQLHATASSLKENQPHGMHQSIEQPQETAVDGKKNDRVSNRAYEMHI
jgi:hypothetical protein